MKEILMTMVVLIVYVRWWLIGLHRDKSVCEFYCLDTRLWIAKIGYYSDKMLTIKSSIPLYNHPPHPRGGGGNTWLCYCLYPGQEFQINWTFIQKSEHSFFFKLKADILHCPMTDWFGQRIGTKLCLSCPKIIQIEY